MDGIEIVGGVVSECCEVVGVILYLFVYVEVVVVVCFDLIIGVVWVVCG